jgi:hypothetical protein
MAKLSALTRRDMAASALSQGKPQAAAPAKGKGKDRKPKMVPLSALVGRR